MRIQATVYAIPTGGGATSNLGTATVIVSDWQQTDSKVLESLWAAAQAKALDHLWDSRLDTTSTPKVEMQALPAWLVVNDYDAESGHKARFVFDVESRKFLGLQVVFASGWLDAPEELATDIQQEVLTRTDALVEPDNWHDIEQVQTWRELPDWAQALVPRY